MKTYAAMIISVLININQFSYSKISERISLQDTSDTEYSLPDEILPEEILPEDTNTEEDESELINHLENLRKEPYNLNEVTLSQIESIPFINSVTAKSIIEYRNINNGIRSKRELMKVSGITEELYEKVKIYFIVRQSDYKKKETKKNNVSEEFNNSKKFNKSVKFEDNLRLKVKLRSRLLRDLQPKAGYLNGKYEGTEVKLYNRLNFKLTGIKYKLEANITAEKDAGEKNFSDFISGYIELKDYKFIKILDAGDYTLNFGQGLSMWSLQAFSKGQEAVNSVKKRGKGIGGYGSVNEVQFFRGAAIKINSGDFNLNLFYSNNYYSASSNVLNGEISSFYYDGYHRTSTEIERKNSVQEKLKGGRLTFETDRFRFGMTYWSSKFSKKILPDTTVNLFRFTGDKAGMKGIDYDLIIKNMNFFGEFALSQTNALAGINGVQFTFFKTADLIFSYRNYPADFMPVHSFGFSERGETYNERGFYAGILIRPLKGLVINSYFDQYKFPYRTYFNPVPVSGNDFLTGVEWKISKGLVLNLKYKNENKEESRILKEVSGKQIRTVVNRNQINARTGFIYITEKGIRFRSRFEFVNVEYSNFGGNSKGYLFYSDINLKPFGDFTFDTRIIFFNTDNYDSRIYEFENDIQGVMSNVPLSGKGRRWYALIKYKPLPLIYFSLKYSETFSDGVKSSGSGNDLIQGDINNRLSAGIEISF